jgi:hypothetical protein
VPDVLAQREPQINIDIDLPAPEVDMCKDPCIADIHNTSESQKPVPIQHQVFVECNLETNMPVFATESIEVPANQADFMQAMLNKLAILEGQKCETANKESGDCVAIPESQQIRLVGIPPQLVVQYAEKISDNKYGPPQYSISIPYYRYSEQVTKAMLFPEYTKGQRFGVLVLPDNSKVIVNACNENEVNKVLDKLQFLIDPEKVKAGIVRSNNDRRGKQLKKIKVVPRIAKYFGGTPGFGVPEEQRPIWIKYF